MKMLPVFLCAIVIFAISFFTSAPQVSAGATTIDFDGIDVSGGVVTGTDLGDYLADHGVSISVVTTNTHADIWNIGAPKWKPVPLDSGSDLHFQSYDHGIMPTEFMLKFSIQF